jgi:hypothetical protein
MRLPIIHQDFLKTFEYPTRYLPERLLKTAGILFVVLFIFLLLFKPFGVYAPEHKSSYLLICLLHALSPALIFYCYFRTLMYVIALKPQRWNLSREYANLAVVFFLIGLASFFLRGFIYNNPDNWSWRYLWEEIRNCYLAGFLIYFFLLFASSYFNKAINSLDRSAGVDDIKNAPVDSVHELFIKTQVQQDDFTLKPSELLFAKAEGNYIELTTYVDHEVRTELKRIPLKQFALQLAPYSFLFRCHRAYLVNLLQVSKFSGNANGYMLLLQWTTVQIPVARAQLETFNQLYKQLALVKDS